MSAARAPIRPSAPDAASGPTLATSIDATSGITVIRIKLTKTVPAGVAIATTAPLTAGGNTVSVRPRMNPAINPSRTRVVNDTRAS